MAMAEMLYRTARLTSALSFRKHHKRALALRQQEGIRLGDGIGPPWWT